MNELLKALIDKEKAEKKLKIDIDDPFCSIVNRIDAILHGDGNLSDRLRLYIHPHLLYQMKKSLAAKDLLRFTENHKIEIYGMEVVECSTLPLNSFRILYDFPAND